ncbi:MAG: hypothetical protein IK997_04730 [Bacilli bacterium]|nr:hypothetical protein [Bacilli bacterium]
MNKSIKKVLVLIILIIVFSTSNVYSLTKTELKNLNLTRLKLYSLETGYRNVQGGTITDKYILLAETYSDNGKTALVVINKKTYKKEKVITKYEFNHANDMTYNSNENKVIITGGKAYPKMYILNGDTLEQEKIEITKRGYSSIAYDKDNDKYIARRGKKAYILDLKFNEEESFDISEEDLTTQGFEVKNGKLYFTCYEAGRITNYQKKYTKILKANENVVVVYDLNTKKKEKVYYIPQVNNEGIYPGEVEGISFIENTPIIWSNKKGYINLFTTIAEKQNESVEIKAQDELENNKILLKLYKNDKLIDQAYNKDGKFTFKNISSEKENTVIYDVKTEDENYKLNTDKLKVKTTYDFYENKLNTFIEDEIKIEKINNEEVEQEKEKINNEEEEQEKEKIEIEEKDTKDNKKEESDKKSKEKEDKENDVKDEVIDNKVIEEEQTNITNDDEIELLETKENDIGNVEVPDTKTNSEEIGLIGMFMVLISLLIIKIKKNN